MNGPHAATRLLSRRAFVQGAGVAGLGLLAGCGRWPWSVQSPKIPRVGWLATFPLTHRNVEAFRQGLREQGYTEGHDLLVEWRATEDGDAELHTLADELVRLPVDVLVAAGGAVARVAKEATSVVPIVFVGVGDPVGAGLVTSLAQPGGNLTGLSNLSVGISAKRLELLKEAVPGISSVVMLWNPSNPTNALQVRESEFAAQRLGLEFQSQEVRKLADLDGALESAVAQAGGALVLGSDPVFDAGRERIVETAIGHGVVTMQPYREYAVAGGLIAYGPSLTKDLRRAAYYVDRILKGAKPADLPVEQPTTFDFVINLKTAQALGLTIPPHVLLQATEVIQ